MWNLGTELTLPTELFSRLVIFIYLNSNHICLCVYTC